MMTDLSPDSTRGGAGSGQVRVEESSEDSRVRGWAPSGDGGGFLGKPGAQRGRERRWGRLRGSRAKAWGGRRGGKQQPASSVLGSPRWWAADGTGGEEPEAGDQGRG